MANISPKNLHIALFPFMSKGHTIPLLHLTKLIHEHRPYATFTIFTTPSNEPFISTSLSSLSPNILTIISLPFQIDQEGAKNRDSNNNVNIPPPKVESTDQLPFQVDQQEVEDRDSDNNVIPPPGVESTDQLLFQVDHQEAENCDCDNNVIPLSGVESTDQLPFQVDQQEAENHDSNNNVIPPGVESTDQLPSMSLFYPFVFALESLRPLFETALEKIQKGTNPITFLICDWFLYWTHSVTSKLNIPRLYFNGMNIYSLTMSHVMFANNIFDGVQSMDEAVQVPGFDGIRLTKNDFDSSFNGPHVNGIAHDFLMKLGHACSTSYGVVVNSFQELELPFLRYYQANAQQMSWCIGPFCLVEKPIKEDETTLWMKWLNKKRDQGKQVLYVAFGSQAEITNEQLKEMAIGLEKSEVDFIWALRIKSAQEKCLEGFEERVKERGMVVRGWVEQRVILEHESVVGFLSHCGWNSILESICWSVPILAWPMMADQHLNARMVVEEIKVGLRVEICDGSVRGFVKWDGLSKMVKELMGGELGKEVKKNVREFSLVANKVVQEGGSSWVSLNDLLNELEKVGAKLS